MSIIVPSSIEIPKGVSSSADAIRCARLDWEVTKEQLFFVDNYSQRYVVDGMATVRRDPNGDVKPLGVVGLDYQPVQNIEAFRFFDNIVQSGEAEYVKAGSLKGGKKIWIMAKLTCNSLLIDGKDSVDMYVVLVNGHCGNHSISVMITPVRIMCSNMLTTAIRKSAGIINFRHTKNIAEQIKYSDIVFNAITKESNELIERMSFLQNRRMDMLDFEEYVRTLLVDSKKVDELFIRAKDIYNNNKNDMLGCTWYRGYQAFIEYIDWHVNYRTEESRLNSIWFGKSRRMKEDALELALDRAR